MDTTDEFRVYVNQAVDNLRRNVEANKERRDEEKRGLAEIRYEAGEHLRRVEDAQLKADSKIKHIRYT